MLNIGSRGLDRLVEISPDLYVLKKRAAYLVVFKQFLVAKVKNISLVEPNLNAHTLNKAFMDVVNYVQYTVIVLGPQMICFLFLLSLFSVSSLLRIPLLAPSTIGEIYNEIICITLPLQTSFGNLGSRVIYRRCKAAVIGELLVKIFLKAN